MLYIFLYLIISTICFHLLYSDRRYGNAWLIGILLILALVVGLGDMLGGMTAISIVIYLMVMQIVFVGEAHF